ncbi:MAG TPA: tetratricopeptide repeat protein [Bryocella sp.]|nr:tetratricopeptide repeat protein [Bryocella sp.]
MSRSRAPLKTPLRHSSKLKPKSQAAAAPVLDGRKVNVVLCLLLAAATVAVYGPAITHPFLQLDDREYVTANVHIRSLGWETIKWAFTSTAAANWHPLTWLSHALDYKLFALNPLGHHLDSVLIHALNVVLLFVGLLWITKRRWPSLLVAALFALHPLNVESVAWIAERKNVLSTLFFLLTLGAYAWYAKKPGWRRYLLVTALFAASLMAKPMGVTLPFVLLLLDYWPLERLALRSSPFATRGNGSSDSSSEARNANREKRCPGQQRALLVLLLEKLPLLVLSAASSWITLRAQRPVVQTFEEFSFANRVQNALVAYGLYLWKTVWPAQLALYPHALGALPAWQWLLSAAVLIAITMFVIVFHRRRYLPVGWFWFLGTLVPVLGLVQVGEYAMADRYAYIPLIGVFVMIAWGLADLASAKALRPAWCAIPAVCVLAALASVTVHQLGYWDSDFDLFSHTLALSETPFAHDAVAMALMNPGVEMTPDELKNYSSEPARVDEARRHFERALELREAMQNADASGRDKARTLNDLGNLDRMQNRLDEARRHDEEALGIYRRLAQQNPEEYLPYLAAALNNVGAIDRLQGHLDQARGNFEESLSINRKLAEKNPAKYLPNVAMVLNEYALVDASQSNMDKARQSYEEALRIGRELAQQTPDAYLPQLAMTLENFALFNAVDHRLDEARQHYQEALQIDRRLAAQNSAVYMPDLAITLSNLGRVEQLQGRVEDARAHYLEAYSLLQTLMRGSDAYAEQMNRVENGLQELARTSGSPQPSPATAAPAR